MASYRQAIRWLIENDDTEWVMGDPQSVTAALVADLFGKPDDTVRKDLFVALKKKGHLRPHAKLTFDDRSQHSVAD